jgi:LuxR family maltose regulon positive regulatory protein
VLVSAPTDLRRERIVKRFAAASRYPVTLVLAAAGWGKTVAVRQFVATLRTPVVRFDVRPEHATLHGFARGFVDALGDVAPRAESGVADAVASALATDAPGATLSEWIAALLRDFDGAIVIDDFHLAENDERCAQLVAATIQRTKHRNAWILAARSAAALPVSSWLVYGDAGVPIDESDLRLTPAEAFDAADAVHPGSDEAGVTRLLAATGGWTTAFYLALNAPEYPNDVMRAAEAAKMLSYDYLAEQVYGSLTDRDRELLLLSAALPDIDADVLERAGVDRARNLLADLQRRVTFLSIVPADAGVASPRRYLCHDLFRAFLERELDLQGETYANAVRLRAARALRAAGRPREALPLFILTGAAEDALELLQRDGFDWHQQGHGDAVLSSVDRLSRAGYAEHPVVLALIALMEAASGNYERAVPLYERALARTGDAEFTAVLAARLALASINAGRDPTEMLESTSSSGHDLPPALRGELLSILAMAYGRFSHFDRLDATLLDEVERLASDTDSPMRRAAILHRLGVSAYMLGDAERSVPLLTGAAELAVTGYRFRMAATIYANLHDVFAFHADDPHAAAAAVARAVDFAEQSGDRYIQRYVTTHRMQVAISFGDVDALEAALAFYHAAPGPVKPVDTLAARGMLAAWEGRFDEGLRAYAELRDQLWLIEDQILATAYCALFAAAATDVERSRAYAQEAIAMAQVRRSPRRAYDRIHDVARSLCALALGLSGRRSAAERDLRRPHTLETPMTAALRSAVVTILRDVDGVQPGDVETPFAILRELGHGGYTRVLEAVLRRRAVAENAVVLTPAELAVLRSLERGRAPKEIAADIGCTVNTVRWHIRRAIEKFGCSGRDQAVRAARARGLI